MDTTPYITKKYHHSCDHCPDCGLVGVFTTVTVATPENIEIYLYNQKLKKQFEDKKWVEILN